MINKDILAVYQIYYSYVREWDQLLFLHRDFTLDRFYWELVEVIRKLLLVSVVVIVGNYAPGYDLVFGIVVLFVFFAMHVYALPYKRGKHNFLKAAEMFAEYMTLFITMLLLLAQVTPSMDSSQMGKAMLGLQGLLGGGMVCVVIINLREGIADLKKQAEQEEGLGVVARVDQVSIYSVFFAINLISSLIKRVEHKRLLANDATSAANNKTAQKRGEYSLLILASWEKMARQCIAGEEDGEEMLLAHALRLHGDDNDDDLDASMHASEGSIMSLDEFSDEASSSSPEPSGDSDTSDDAAEREAQEAEDEARLAGTTGGGGNFSEEGVGIDRLDCV